MINLKVLALRMKKNPKTKVITKKKRKKLQEVIAEFSEISRKRKKELIELDHIAKMLIRRDLELSEIREKRELEVKELEEKTEELEKSRNALINILEDVEEARVKAEEERNRTLTIISNLSDGLLVFDKNNKILLTNYQTEGFFNIKTKEILGKSISELAVFSNLRPLINLLGSEIRGIFRKELTIKKSLILEISTVPMIIGEEKLGILVILHDITREKMIEKMKTEFVSLAAHQLRTPLSAIKWTLKMLLEEDLGKITNKQRDFIEKTYQSNERMISLINDLLDITRIEEGRYLFKPQLSQIENIVQFVINSLKEEIKKKKIKFTFEKPKKKLPKVKVDVEKIRLAIYNIIDNAIRYTPTGGEVTISLKDDKKEIEFSVKDSGVGIPEDQKQRIFAKFFRGANVMRMETEGTGLGLFIAKNIIEAHKGKVWFESEEKKGTTFYFTLPLKKEFEEFLKEF